MEPLWWVHEYTPIFASEILLMLKIFHNKNFQEKMELSVNFPLLIF